MKNIIAEEVSQIFSEWPSYNEVFFVDIVLGFSPLFTKCGGFYGVAFAGAIQTGQQLST